MLLLMVCWVSTSTIRDPTPERTREMLSWAASHAGDRLAAAETDGRRVAGLEGIDESVAQHVEGARHLGHAELRRQSPACR